MFGKGGGTLSTWLKEFCQLVFIQTIQAFIYAIIIGVIMSLYETAAAGDSAAGDYASSLGLFAVIGLMSVFKIEDVVRKVFGFGNTKADHGSAVKSMAKTAFALHIGKRVLDNGKKVVGGAKNILSANKDARKAANRLSRIKNTEEEKERLNAGKSNSGSSPVKKIDSKKRSEKIRLFNDAQKARKLAQSESDPAKKKALIAEAKSKLAQARAIDDVESEDESSVSRDNANVSISSASNSSDYHQKMKDLKDQYEKELSAAKAKRKEGIRTMTKGVMETTGAVIGATAGGILGFAAGDFDEGVRSVVSGAGLGDAAGELTTKAAFGASDLVEGAYNSTKGAIKDYSKSITEQYNEEKSAVMSQLKDMNKEARAEIQRINKGVEKARENLADEVKMSAGQTAKAIAKSVGKGSAKAYKSRHGGIRQLKMDIKDLEKHINKTATSVNLINDVESID